MGTHAALAFLTFALAACQPSGPPPELPPAPPPPPTVAPPTAAPAPPSDLTPPTDAQPLIPGARWRVEKRGTSDTRADPADQVRLARATFNPAGALLESAGVPGGELYPVAGLPPSVRAAVLGLAPAEEALIWVDVGVDGPGAPAMVHRLTLIDIVPGKRLPRLTGDVSTPPEGARARGPGITCVETRAGTGRRPPGAKDRVRIAVDCYALDGTFAEGAARGNGASELPFSEVPRALKGVLATLSTGATARCWVKPGVDLGLGRALPDPAVCDVDLQGVQTAP